MWVVVMFEPVLGGESLSLSEQVNEVFGPFDSDEKAEQWTLRMRDAMPTRQWLIVPMSDPGVVLSLDVVSN
jgi:hypothetical protein